MSVSIGVDLRGPLLLVLAVDAAGRVVAETTAPLSLDAAVDVTLQVAKDAGLDDTAPIGLAAWEPKIAEVEEIARRLGGRRGRVAVTGAGLAAAAAETWVGAARDSRYAACLLVGEHVSAGAIVDGRPWRGAHGLAGSAAWLALNPVERQDYRQFGCLDAEISDRGIARRLTWRVEAGDLSRVVEQAGGLEAVTAAHVFDGARGRDGVAISVVRDTARYVGMAIANLVTLFDPDVVVVGGFIATAQDLLLEPVRQECHKRLSPAMSEHLRLELTSLGDRAVALGAAHLAAAPAS
jgi:glucokinase